MTIIDRLATAHDQLIDALIRVDHLPSDIRTPTTADEADLDRGWVPLPLSDHHVEQLEQLAGFGFSPLLRALFQTAGAMPVADVGGVLGVSSWVGSFVFEKNRDVARAREEYDWDLPKLVAITWEEDFLAVTEHEQVVKICGNEGNIESRHGSLEEWLGRYTSAASLKAADPEGYEDNGDPEAEYD
jgi:hypothetical protein